MGFGNVVDLCRSGRRRGRCSILYGCRKGSNRPFEVCGIHGWSITGWIQPIPYRRAPSFLGATTIRKVTEA
jgi:hypothetical protein